MLDYFPKFLSSHLFLVNNLFFSNYIFLGNVQILFLFLNVFQLLPDLIQILKHIGSIYYHFIDENYCCFLFFIGSEQSIYVRSRLRVLLWYLQYNKATWSKMKLLNFFFYFGLKEKRSDWKCSSITWPFLLLIIIST